MAILQVTDGQHTSRQRGSIHDILADLTRMLNAAGITESDSDVDLQNCSAGEYPSAPAQNSSENAKTEAESESADLANGSMPYRAVEGDSEIDPVVIAPHSLPHADPHTSPESPSTSFQDAFKPGLLRLPASRSGRPKPHQWEGLGFHHLVALLGQAAETAGLNLAITINLDQEHEEIAKAAGKDLAAWAIKTFENCVHATCRELGIEAGENIAVLEQRGIFYEKGFWSFEGPLVDVEATESYAHSGERGFDLHAALRVDIDRESFRRCLGKHVAKRITGNRVAAQARTPSGQKSRAVTWKLDRENRVKVVEITTEAGGASGWVKYITKIATLTESYHNDVVERRPWRVSRGLTQRARRHLDLLVREFGPDAALGILDGMHAAQKEKERLRRRSSDQRPRKRPGRWR